MSEVTNLILTCTLAENEQEIISQIEGYKNLDKNFSIVSVNDDKLTKGWYGGSKYLESHVFIGAYNHLDLPQFIEHLKSVSWEDPEDVQLIVKQQNDFHFRIINVFNEENS